LAQELLGSHVRRRADQGAGAGERLEVVAARLLAGLGDLGDGQGGLLGVALAGGRLPGQAEVDHAGPLFLVEEHVVRLEIAVDQSGVMSRGQSPPGGDEQIQALAPGSRLGVQPGPQSATAQELHRQEHPPLHHAHVVNGDDVGVGQAGHGLGLTHQARRGHRVGAGAVRIQDLEGDLAVQLGVVRAIDHSHGAAPDALQDSVATQLLAGGKIAGGRVRPRLRGRGVRTSCLTLHSFPPFTS
jgi:hypothetical protein